MACGLPIGVQRYVDYEATIRPPVIVIVIVIVIVMTLRGTGWHSS